MNNNVIKNNIIQGDDEFDGFEDAKNYFTNRNRNVQESSYKNKLNQSMQNNLESQGEQKIDLNADKLVITARGGKYGDKQTVSAFGELETLTEEQINPKKEQKRRRSDFTIKNEEETNTLTNTIQDIPKVDVKQFLHRKLDVKFRSLRRLWKEKDAYTKSLLRGKESVISSYKFTPAILDPNSKSYCDLLPQSRLIDVTLSNTNMERLIRSPLNILNVQISDKKLGKIYENCDGTRIIIRSKDKINFYMISFEEKPLVELIDHVFWSEVDPTPEYNEEFFLNRIFKVVNRYSIQDYKFSDLRWVPGCNDKLWTAGDTFVVLWTLTNENILQIHENTIYNLNDPVIKFIYPVSSNLLFIVGKDNSLYVKIFNIDLNTETQENKSGSLSKTFISVSKLYAFNTKVKDMIVNEAKNLIVVVDKEGMLYKLKYLQKGNEIVVKLINSFSIRDNSGFGITNYFSDIYARRLYEINGIGFIVQRSDNRLLLYNYENNEYMLKLKDFNVYSGTQLSFDPNHSYIYIPCNNGEVRVFDYLNTSEGVINSLNPQSKIKNSDSNCFIPQPDNLEVKYYMVSSNTLARKFNLEDNNLMFSFSEGGRFSVYLSV